MSIIKTALSKSLHPTKENQRAIILLFKDDLYTGDTDDMCEVYISVEEENGDDHECYDITFMIRGSDRHNPLNIFEEDDQDGVIVAKNGMTKSIVEHLLMDDEELLEASGMATLQGYRREIMCALVRLWD